MGQQDIGILFVPERCVDRNDDERNIRMYIENRKKSIMHFEKKMKYRNRRIKMKLGS
jgi:hypothetical protein